MECDAHGDPASILTQDPVRELQDTLHYCHRVVRPHPVETALAKYADSLQQLVGTISASTDDPYTRGFVAGLRAAAKVASNEFAQ